MASATTLEEERARIDVTLKSKARLKTLIKEELREDAKKYGDARRSPLVEREAAQALDETALVASEPITVVLSAKGWVRAAKGHDVDATDLGYRDGDKFLAAAQGRTTQQAAFIDSTGRSYSTPAHTLPSARGNGEPLTGRFTPPAGARFDAVAIADPATKLVIASDRGYGFVTRFEALLANKKAGKQLINVEDDARVLAPALVADSARDRIVVVTTAGHLLMFSVADLPELDKRQGQQADRDPEGEARAAASASPASRSSPRPRAKITLYAGARKLTLKWSDLVEYGGNRAARGGLPAARPAARRAHRDDRLTRPSRTMSQTHA